MVAPGPEAPRLVALDGPMAHVAWTIPVGVSTIGRDAETGIVVQHDSVSRRHASLHRDGGRVTLGDLGSTNGTWINGHPVHGREELHPGDTIRVGHVSLAYVADPAPPASGYRFDTVYGAVHAGEGDQYLHDQRSYHYTSSNDYDPWDEAFTGTGPGRVLTVLGGLIALAGFGLVLYFFYVVFGADISDPAGQSPFAVRLGGAPVIALGFGGFLAGGVLAGIGSGMSKAARKRSERRRRETRDG